MVMKLGGSILSILISGRACLRDAMMYMFCLRAHRFI